MITDIRTQILNLFKYYTSKFYKSTFGGRYSPWIRDRHIRKFLVAFLLLFGIGDANVDIDIALAGGLYWHPGICLAVHSAFLRITRHFLDFAGVAVTLFAEFRIFRNRINLNMFVCMILGIILESAQRWNLISIICKFIIIIWDFLLKLFDLKVWFYFQVQES